MCVCVCVFAPPIESLCSPLFFSSCLFSFSFAFLIIFCIQVVFFFFLSYFGVMCVCVCLSVVLCVCVSLCGFGSERVGHLEWNYTS